MPKVNDLFNDAMELPPDERRAFLKRACGEDAGLRAEVESLLSADDQASRFLDRPALSLVVDGTSPAPQPSNADAYVGRRIGDYHILSVVGSGGMGVVFEAEQLQPRRRVALKLMRTGLASPSAARRFEDEAQILARLSHAGIAQVYEAGMHQDGTDLVPYFAMEFVTGARTLTEFAARNQLSAPERLTMFAIVCDAVHYGHQRGVIHRDLKPGNILVDASGQPKVIDFGIARVADADPRATTRQTDLGLLVGTLTYMSPEQFGLDARHVDIRSDQYSLGVVLYELMCGQLPYDIRNASIAAAARIIQEQTQRRLSSVDRSLRGDVEAIVHKAMEKDSAARYESVADLARDIRRSLEHRPIEARPPNALYQFRKLVRRHKSASILVAVFLLSICMFGAAMSVLYARSEGHRKAASQAEQYAEEQAAAAERVSASLESIIRGLAPVPPTGVSLSVDDALQPVAPVEVLDRCAAEIERKLRGQPLAQARLRDALGNAYLTLGRVSRARQFIEAALEQRRRALPDPHLDLAASLFSLAILEETSGRDEIAESLHREVIRMRLALLKDTDLEVRSARLRLFRVLVRRRDLVGAKSVISAYAATCREIHDMGPAALAGVLHTVGTFLMDKGDFSEAEANLRESLSLRELVPGPEMADIIEVVHVILGSLAYKRGRYDEALERFTAARPTWERIHGKDAPSTIHLLNNVALARGLTGDVDGSLDLFDVVLRKKRKLHGERGYQVGHSLYDLSTVLYMKGDPAAAQAAAREALGIMRDAEYSSREVFLGAILDRLGDLALERGEPAEAEGLAREALDFVNQRLPPEHWQAAETRNLLARCLAARGMTQEARPMLAESHAILDRVFEGRIPPTIRAEPPPASPGSAESTNTSGVEGLQH